MTPDRRVWIVLQTVVAAAGVVAAVWLFGRVAG